MKKNLKVILPLFVLTIVSIGIGAWLILNNPFQGNIAQYSPTPIASASSPSPSPTLENPYTNWNPPSDWQTYRNENLGWTLRYPPTWEILTNFENTHFSYSFRDKQWEGSMEWPGLVISTIDAAKEFRDMPFLSYFLSSSQSGISRIIVTLVNTQLFTSCAFYSDSSVVDTCNKIISTLRTNWLTYRSNQYGLEINYPKGWLIEENETAIEISNYEDVFSKATDAIYIQLSVPQTHLELQELYTKLEDLQPGKIIVYRSETYTKISNDTLNGIPAIRYAKDYEPKPIGDYIGHTEDILIQHQNAILKISWTGWDQMEKKRKIVNKILSTLQFI